MNEYDQLVAFIKELDRLKDTTRTAWTKEGRQESVAEHSWRLAMFAMVLVDYFPGVDRDRVVRMSLVHDLGEAYEGDISAKIGVSKEDKLKREEAALRKLFAPLPESIRSGFLALWREYNDGKSQEAKIVKALDKIETIIQHNQGDNPSDFDYEFNLQYGKEYMFSEPVIQSIREIIDGETRRKVKDNKPALEGRRKDK
ncbi:MAG TPA: HD domain-containing protein [Bacillota bacterium]